MAAMRAFKIEKNIIKSEDESLEKYMIEVGHLELISAEQEVELARLIKQGDSGALRKLVEAKLRFVIEVAINHQGQGLSLSLLMYEGNILHKKAGDLLV